MTGDFNFIEGTDNYRTIIESGILTDSKDQAKDSMSHGTMNWFMHLNFQLLMPIDFCFVSGEGILVDTYRVDNSYWLDGKPVSDHYPVIVDVRLGEFSNAYVSKYERNLGRDFVKDHKDFIEIK